MIERYSGISPKGDLLLLRKLAEKLAGKTFLHINSTREGGGVAEILQRMIPIMSSLGIKARWEVITGDDRFFDMTKKVHNALQGYPETVDEAMWEHHRAVNEKNSATLNLEADAAVIHDPQPVPLVNFRKVNFDDIHKCFAARTKAFPIFVKKTNTECRRHSAAAVGRRAAADTKSEAFRAKI